MGGVKSEEIVRYRMACISLFRIKSMILLSGSEILKWFCYSDQKFQNEICHNMLNFKVISSTFVVNVWGVILVPYSLEWE